MLRHLQQARTFGGWLLDELPAPTPEQLEAAAIHLEGTDLRGGFERSAHLKGARFTGANLGRLAQIRVFESSRVSPFATLARCDC